MKRKPFTTAASVLLAIVTVLHVARVVTGCDIAIEGWRVPVWLNTLGAIVTGTLSVMLWKESRS